MGVPQTQDKAATPTPPAQSSAAAVAAAPTTMEAVDAVVKPLVDSAVGALVQTGATALDIGAGALLALAYLVSPGTTSVNDTIPDPRDNGKTCSADFPEPAPAAGGAGAQKGGAHGNTIGNQHAELYALVDASGKFLKWGVSQDASTRYSKSELNGGRVIVVGSGTRDEMIALERALTESRPGPLNNEPWAGSAK